MLNVYLLRHGETPWNAAGNRYCGRTDVPLTEKGIGQASVVREQLKDIVFDAIYSSPLQRAFRTAEIASGGAEVIADDRLIEADFGKWEGKTREEFIAENPVDWDRWDLDPMAARAGGTGETARELISRVDHFFGDAFQRHPSGNILVVAHNGVNRLYLAWKLGMPVRYYRRLVQENSSVTLFSLDADGEIQLKLLNARPGR
jgi:alpha-ribazole phosphatase/probable phosphoglycerate mutase